MKQQLKKNLDLLEWYDAIVAAIVALLVIFTFFVRVIRVNGNSMNPTLYNGERLLIASAPYQANCGDVIVVDSYAQYGEPLVKRVIAVGGDTVNIDFDAGLVYVNDTALDEPYTAEPTYYRENAEFPLTVPDGCLFVMGDNRNHSLDSRSIEVGCIDTRDVLGRVLLRLMPFNKVGVIK